MKNGQKPPFVFGEGIKDFDNLSFKNQLKHKKINKKLDSLEQEGTDDGSVKYEDDFQSPPSDSDIHILAKKSP